MKKLLLTLLVVVLATTAYGYPKTPLVERFTNASCGPCAVLNAGWYRATVASLQGQGYLEHIVYNVNWPGPTDPMYLLNSSDNMTRRAYYLVDAVPWIEIDGTLFNYTGNNAVDQANFTSIVQAAHASYSPFDIDVQAQRYTSGVIDVTVTVMRDPADVSVLPPTIYLQTAVLEDMVTYTSPPGTNGETEFPDVSRKMLDDATGSVITVPAPGGTTTKTFTYIPSAQAQSLIDFSDVSVLAFVQDNASHTVYQSKKVTPDLSDQIHAAFRTEDTVGAVPFMVTFEDLSTPATGMPITSWAWDFDNDGVIDSTDPAPSWTYTTAGIFTVALTVGDGTNTHTMTRENLVQAVTNQASILVVNGIEYATYGAEFATFYASSAIFGSHQVDVWDLFGDQGYDYLANPSIQQVIAQKHKVPDAVWRLYQTVVWVGNNYSGDLDYYDANQILSYLADGGNVILATRYGANFLSTALRSYCGISAVSGDRTVTNLVSLDPELIDMPANAGHTLVHFVTLSASSEAVPIFRETTEPTMLAGFKLHKSGQGTFVYVAGRPYRYNTAASYQNYDTMLGPWLTGPTGIGDDITLRPFVLTQNQPNPFNPSTQIHFAVAQPGPVSLKIYDMSGRLVRTLVNEARPANEYTVTWNGQDDRGAGVAAGVYLYRLDTRDGSLTKRMVLVK